MKFIGHLDTMRYFQKAVRRAGIPAAYSGGFSPHMIMSFAAPLGVGITSAGEYFDMELAEPMTSAELLRRFNRVMAEGIKVISVRQIPEGKANVGMALVAAADYRVTFREGYGFTGCWRERFEDFIAQDEIFVMRRTKRSEAETDIRPWILEASLCGGAFFFRLSQGSVHNLKPELVMEAFAAYLGQKIAPYSLAIHRLEVYAEQKSDGGAGRLVPLEALGEEIL